VCKNLLAFRDYDFTFDDSFGRNRDSGDTPEFRIPARMSDRGARVRSSVGEFNIRQQITKCRKLGLRTLERYPIAEGFPWISKLTGKCVQALLKDFQKVSRMFSRSDDREGS
jgi:hypothetical protein